jgi:glycosyltransferase involved in cell wall biosynthesis
VRLCLLHYTKPPVPGGVERVLGELGGALRELGHEVDLWDREDWRRGLAEAGPDGLRRRWAAVLVHNVFTMPFDLEWTRELTAFSREWPELVWVNWVHDVAAVNPAYAALGWAEPPPRARHVAVSGPRADEWAAVAGLERDEVTVIPNGFDPRIETGLTDRMQTLADEAGLWTADLVLAHPARFVRRKRIETGVRLVAELRGGGLDARLVVTGAPDPHQADGAAYHAELRELAERLGAAERVVFAGEGGPLDREDVSALLALSDALFFPSSSEGYGLPPQEAVLRRLPVWCSDLPVHREVLGGCEARFFPVETDPRELAIELAEWARARPWQAARRRLMRERDWRRLCKERLEPLLPAG